jgi:adenine-specific DNA-methyltransferase
MKSITQFINQILCGDCVQVMQGMPAQSVDLVVTDPPYIVRYTSRDGRSYPNDDNDRWLLPAFTQIYRVLKPDSFCICFYGWLRAETFLQAWKGVGFRPIGHLVFIKDYSSREGFIRYHHEGAYLLAKGDPPKPDIRLSDVLDWQYTGNRLHPTQKPLLAVIPLILAFSNVGDIVLDPFAGSGTTAAAAQLLDRRYIGIELDPTYCRLAQDRLKKGGDTPMAYHTPRQPQTRAPQAKTAPRGERLSPFSITCKGCNRKLWIPAAWVFKYLERIGYHAQKAA